MADFGVNVGLNIVTSKQDLTKQIKDKIGDSLDIGAKLVINPESIDTLSKSLQQALDTKQFKVNIGNVKLLDSAKSEMKKQIEQMFGYSTRETTLETKELQKQVALLEKKAAAYETNAKKAEEELRKQRESLKNTQEKTIALKNQKDALSEIYNTTKKLVDQSGNDSLKDELTVYKQLMNELSVKKEVLGNDELNARIDGMRRLSEEARKLVEVQNERIASERAAAAASAEAEQNEANRAKLLSQLEYQYHRLTAGMEKFQHTGLADVDTIDNEEVKETVQQYENLKEQFEQLMKSSDDFSTEAIQDLYNQANALNKVTGAIRSEANEQTRQNNLLRQAHALYQNMYQFLQGNPGVSASSTGSALRSLMGDLKSRTDSGSITAQDMAEINRQYGILIGNAKTLGIVGKENDTIFKQLLNRFSLVSIAVAGFHKAIQVCKDMVENVKELDAAMTELRKVTTETEAGYAKFFETAGDRAKELGATVVDVISATADFARLGYSIDDAAVLADVATIYKNVGDGINNIDEAAQSIISTMKAFGVETQDAISIVDKFNETGNNFAISSKGVGDALIRSASALAAANNSLDESVALVTAMNSTVQSPEKVGNALKTLAAYLRSSKTDLEELGETGELIADSIPKLQEKMVALTHGAVQILERDGVTIRSTYNIMRDLSNIWDTGFLTDVDQAAILEMIAGKRQSSTVASLLQNFQTAEEVLARIGGNNAFGSAITENEKYLESINGKIAQFDAAFEQLSAHVMNSDFVKHFYETLTGITSAFDGMLTAFGGMQGVMPMLSAIAGLFVGGSTRSNPITWIQQLHRMFSGSGELLANIRGAQGIIEEYNGVLKEGKDVAIEYARAAFDAGDDSTGLARYLNELKGAPATVDGYVASLKEMGVSTAAYTVRLGVAKIAQMAFNAAVTAFISIGVSTAITLISKAISDYTHRLDNAIEKTEKLDSDWKEFDKTNAENIKTIEGMSEEFEELSKGVDKYGKNISLTEEQYSRYKDIVDKIVEISPTLVQGYNAEGQAIIDKNDAIQETIRLLKEQRQLELMEETAPQKMAERLQGNAAQYQKYEQDLNDLRRAYGTAAGAFFSGGKGAINFRTAGDLIKQFGISGINTANYIGRNGSNGFDGAAFAADFMDALAPRMSELAPEMFGYSSRSEMDQYYKNVVAAQIEINNQQQKMSAELDKMEASLSLAAQANADWDSLPAAMQDVVSSYIESYVRDIKTLADTNLGGDYKITENKVVEAEAAIDRMIAAMLDDRVQEAFKAVERLRSEFSSGKISSDEYRTQGEGMLRGYTNSGLSQYALVKLKVMLDLDSLDQEAEQAATAVSQQVQDIMETLKVDANGLADAFDFSESIKSIDDVGSSLANLASAMLQVQDGTMLTAQEINKLIAEYPELVQAGDLYAADTIENQQAILEHFLSTKEAQYNATIDEQIAELEAEKKLIEMQIDAEIQKAQVIATTRAAMNNGSLKNAADYQEALNMLMEAEKTNYVTLEEGKVKYNAQALSALLASDADYAKKSQEDVWQVHAEDLAAVTESAYETVTTNLAAALSRETAAFSQFKTQVLTKLNKDVQEALVGAMTDTSGYTYAGTPMPNSAKKSKGVKKILSGVTVGDVTGGTFKNDIPDSYKSAFKEMKTTRYDELKVAMSDYLDSYEKMYQENVKRFRAEISTLDSQIAMLRSVKNIDFKTVYGTPPSTKSSSKDKGTKSSSSGGSSSKEAKQVEIYLADLDEYYKAEKKLAQVQFERAQIQAKLDDSTDLKEKIELERQLAEKYGEEAEAQGELLKLKEQTIMANVEVLKQLGFEADYNSATHSLYIDNMEHLNELTADTKGEYETLEEATNALRQSTEKLISSTETLTGDVGSASDAIRECGKETKEAKERIVEYLNEMVNKANEVVDGFQSIYDTFTQAAKEYSSSGFLSVDSLQSILQLGPKYLQLLYDEAGQLAINKERIQDIIAARSREMAVQTAYAHVQQIIEALNNDDDKALRELVQVTKDFTEETWGSVYALAAQADTLAKIKGKGDMFEFSVTDQVRMIESSYQTMISSMDEYWKSVEDGYTTQKDALQDVIDQAIEYYKWENEKKSDALEKEKDDFKDIIEKRKEALRLAKEEDKRNADVEDKLREIAKLQRKIDQLSLDDSREARAQKASLEEELYQLQKGIAEEQNEASVSAAEDALDKQYDAFEKEKDKEIKALGKEMQSYQKLYDRAIAELTDDWEGMYQKILDYNHEYGTDLDKNVIAKWEQAAKAVERYGSVRDAVEGVKSDKYFGDYQTPEYAKYEQTVMEAARTAAVSMKANSIAWLTASKDARPDIEKENERLGYGAGMTKVNGAWYMPNGERAYKLTAAEYTQPLLARIAVDVAKLAMVQDEAERKRIQDEIEYFKKTLADMKAMEKFHTGGIVGDYKSLKQNEVMAVLQKGEAVLDKQKENALYKLVDFAALLQKKLGTSIDTGLLGMLTRSAVPAIPRATAYAAGAAGGVNFAPSITVEINHSGSLSEADAQRYGNIAADAALDKLSDAFGRRGITNFGNSLLKGAQS